MNSTWDSRRELEERLTKGGGITLEEVKELIEDVDEGELSLTLMEALTEALSGIGLIVVDCSSDDGYEFKIMKAPDVETKSVLL